MAGIKRAGATQASVDTISTNVSTILAAVDTEVASILAAVDTEIGALTTAVAAVQTDTDDLQLRVPNVVRKTITFTGATGLGEIGAVPLFTTTGQVHVVRIMPFCTTDVAGATGTLALGVTGSTSLFIAATTGTDIDTNEFWVDTAPDAAGVALPAALQEVMINANIIGTVATANLTGGVIAFVVHWWPISAGATLVAA